MHLVNAKKILNSSNGMNIYRGCLHGCIYCDARSNCYQMEHDFEDIEVKQNAPELLEAALKAKRRRCMIGTGGMSDPYLPIERELRLTRRCLELIDQYEFGVSILTKSDMIMRDIELLERINCKTKAVVQMTITTADEKLCRIVEPHVCTTAKRFETLCEMKKRGIPTVIWLCPLLPFINDTEYNVREIVRMGGSAGVYGILTFGMGLTLRAGDREFFYSHLDNRFPGLKERYIRTYGNNYELPSPNTKRLYEIFINECEKYGIEYQAQKIFDFLNEFPEYEQLSLF